MQRKTRIEPRKYRAYTRRDIDSIRPLKDLDADDLLEMKAVSAVLPFRVNEYVIAELIDWDDIPNDPIYSSRFRSPGCSPMRTAAGWWI